jgi:glutathione synthase/RimK-type ligase-like ATP-grasp enzyme
MPKKRPATAKPPSAPFAPEDRIPLNILFGLPDDQRVKIKIGDEGRSLGFDLPGTADIVPHLSPERFATELIYLQRGTIPPVILLPAPLLNHIGDPDICSQALKIAEHVVRDAARPCFNHPRAVASTTRDAVSRVLTGIAGLVVPKTIRVDSSTAAQLRTAVAEAGLDYPIIIRVAGSHRGLNMIRADNPRAVDEIDRLDRSVQRSLYATEFHDFVSPDRRYRKLRIAVAGEDIFLRHLVLSKNWLIHGGTGDTNTKEEEAMFASFDVKYAARLRPVFHEIARRLDLDFFGIDCNINESGEILLFEANACMGILGLRRKMMPIKAAGVTRIRQAVEELLASPATWRHFHTGAHVRKEQR